MKNNMKNEIAPLAAGTRTEESGKIQIQKEDNLQWAKYVHFYVCNETAINNTQLTNLFLT